MKTDVQSTSIAAYHTLQTKEQQKERIARFILQETKSARWAWIGKVAGALGMEKSTVSARMHDLKTMTENGDPIILDSVEYEIKFAGKVMDSTTGVTVQAWALLRKAQPTGEQLTMFQ